MGRENALFFAHTHEGLRGPLNLPEVFELIYAPKAVSPKNAIHKFAGAGRWFCLESLKRGMLADWLASVAQAFLCR